MKRERSGDGHTEGVEVHDRIHGHTAQHAGGGVAEAVGRPGLGAVVQRDGKHHQYEREDDQRKVQRHGF
jgi:hypothetical protein